MNPHSSPAAPGSSGGELRDVQELQRRGRFVEAEQRLQALAERQPGDPAVHRALALLAAQTARPDLARLHMATAVRLAPASGLLRCELGRLLAGEGRLAESLEHFREAAVLEPALAEAWFFLGITLVRLDRGAEAAPALRQALALAPDQVQILAPLADLEFRAGNDAAALPLWQRLVQQRPGEEDARLKLGETLTRLGRHAEARTAFREALQALPGSSGLWMALGQAEEDAGDRDQAEQAYGRALALRPGWAFPLSGLLGLHRAKSPDSRVGEAEALQRGDALSDPERALIGYSLGKVYDGRGDYARAMASWQDANAARRRETAPLDRARFAEAVERILAGFPAGALAGAATGPRDPRPVFVVGMPRSGTTLVEQIIASHPQAAGCGELPDLGLLAEALPVQPVADAARLQHDAARLLATAERHASRPAALRLVDKAPLNFFHLGLAAQLFPGARVIWCRREARDIGLSIFSENFALDSLFATDLGDIGLTVNAQHRLMRHWQATLPVPVLEVDYEALVTDIEPGIRRIIDFLGLPWDAACLDFHTSERAVQTPSRWQVRRPAHTGSIGRWRNYAPWLSPLTEALALPAGADGVIKS
ncbi:tetratricopeptide repeat-containing sulfotransferase family protein [Arenimonas terrae]|uniref:Sulfotransferase family protein n=1 Tax=Arenimonas terrae TaxID=2546226 RepID=A0A5C4RRV7_9GAMM|nr:tetratricopeptide repeat-containing sulfotransferase family protein [Arenimonas terrae]TNJ33695.1 sulfotransferase family protein [Arenimonas terrae]